MKDLENKLAQDKKNKKNNAHAKQNLNNTTNKRGSMRNKTL